MHFHEPGASLGVNAIRQYILVCTGFANIVILSS